MNQAEYKIHVAIVDHHRRAFPHVMLVHIPNAGTDAKRGFFAKQMGAHPGAHDLMLFWKDGVGAIEVKQPGGRLSTPQNKFASSISRFGVKTGIVTSVRAYHNLLMKWGVGPYLSAITEPDLATFDEKVARGFDLYKP